LGEAPKSASRRLATFAARLEAIRPEAPKATIAAAEDEARAPAEEIVAITPEQAEPSTSAGSSARAIKRPARPDALGIRAITDGEP
jgi:hypothetical protein